MPKVEIQTRSYNHSDHSLEKHLIMPVADFLIEHPKAAIALSASIAIMAISMAATTFVKPALTNFIEQASSFLGK